MSLLNGLGTDTVSRQKVGHGIYENAGSGEECDLVAAHYKWGALCRIIKDLIHS